MSRREWLQFFIGFLLGMAVLASMPSSAGCSKLATITGACEVQK